MGFVKFTDVVKRANTKEDRFNTAKLYYVGGEHIDSEEMLVNKRGLIKGSTIGPMFYCGFNAGQILFVTRNPHLRKCGMATFDGICSEKTFVLETKNASILDQRYLAVMMQSDEFWDYCEENKSGGVNYFINWSTLADYEFDLPSLDEQKSIADKAWAAYELKQSYIKMIAATDELVKSRFIEMFGNPNSNSKSLPTKKVSELFSLQMGKTPARNNPSYWDSEDHKWISIADMSNYGRYTDQTSEYITDLAVKESGIKVYPKGTVIMSFKLTIGKTAITSEDIYSNEAIVGFIPKDNSYNTEFLYDLIKNYDWHENAAQAVKGKTLNKESIGANSLIIPSIEEQNKWIEISKQADKSKFELNNSIAAIDKVIKSLINENI